MTLYFEERSLTLTNLPNFEAMPDEEIAGRVRAGEIALYEIIMRRYNQRLFRIARAIVRNDLEAEDVIQEAYVRAYANLDQFAGRAKFSTWLTKIAINEALARAKRDKSFDNMSGAERSGGMDDMESPDRTPEQQALNHEARAFLESAIDTLAPGYRAVFVMREIEEMTTAETAECLEITEQTVKTRLFRAREMIRAELISRAGVAGSKAFEFLGAPCDRVVAEVFRRINASGKSDPG